MKIKVLLLTIISVILAIAAEAQSNGAPFANVECIRTDLDGSLTVRVASFGKKKSDAKMQARKDAVYEAIFKGIKVKNNAQMSRPLLYEVNAEEKYQDFFNEFFVDGGKFMEFGTLQDAKSGTTHTRKEGSQKVTWINIRVQRGELKRYLIESGIIKQ